MPEYYVTKDLGVVPFTIPFKRKLLTRVKNLGSLDGDIEVLYDTYPEIKVPKPYITRIKGDEEKILVGEVEYDLEYIAPDEYYSDEVSVVINPLDNNQETIYVNYNIVFRTEYAITTHEATNDPKQRKIHYMKGRYWFFFSNGTKIYYQHSSDAVNWSHPIPIFGGRAAVIRHGFRFDTFFDGYYLHLAFLMGRYLFYSRGDPRPDGTILFDVVPSLVDEVALQTLSISVDTLGYPWIAIDKTHIDASEMIVYKSSTNDGIFVTESGFPKSLELAPEPLQLRATILRLEQGRMLALWLSHNEEIRASVWDGSDFSPVVLSTDRVLKSPDYGVVVDGNLAHILYMNYERKLKYELFDADAMEYRNLTEITDEEVIEMSSGMITLDDSTGDIYASWITPSDTVYALRRRRFSGGVWSNPSTIAEIESITPGCRPTQSHLLTPAGIGYAWEVGDSPPYRMRILFS